MRAEPLHRPVKTTTYPARPATAPCELSAFPATVKTMNDLDTPWEPPLAGTEAEHLLGALDRLRTTFRWKADDLDAAGLSARVGSSALTLGGLLKHLAACEDVMFTTKLTGAPPGAPWDAFGTAAATGPSPSTPPGFRRSSSTASGTARSSARTRGSPRPSPKAASTSWSTSLGPTAAVPACAAWSAT